MINKHHGGDALEFIKAVVDANPDARTEYDRLGPRYEVIRGIVRARKAAGLTQAQLAERMQVSRPVVTRLESGEHEPRLNMIQRAADALGRRIVVEFKPRAAARDAAAGVPKRSRGSRAARG